MTQIKKNTQNNTDEVAKIGKPATDSTVEVLYQKLGDEWYAFSIINDEVFFGKVENEGHAIDSPKRSA